MATIDKNDVIHLIYLQNEAAGSRYIYYDIYYTKIDSVSGETLFGPIRLLDSDILPGFLKEYKDMIITDSGIIHTIGDLYLRFNDQGELLERDPELKGSSIAEDMNGDINIAEIRFIPIPSGGLSSILMVHKWDGSFWTDLELERHEGRAALGEVDITSDAKGNLYLAYTTYSPKRGLYIRKYDSVWSEKEEIFTVDPVAFQVNTPKLIVDTNENIHVIFAMEDFNNNFGYNPDCSINKELFHVKYDESNGWVERKRVSNGDRFSFHYSLALDNNNDLHVVWEDTRDNRNITPPCDINWLGYFEIYHDYYSEIDPARFDCLELIPDHNNLNENRINLVFLGFDYTDETGFKNRIIDLVNINGAGPPDDTGLLSEPPFRDYQNKFNLWYVNKTLPYVEGTYSEDIEYLSSICQYTNNRQEVRLIKNHLAGSSASPEGDYLTLSDKFDRGIEFNRDTLLHEFGHSFGNLFDEYGMGYAVSYYPSYPNCDGVNGSVGCPKWCSGDSVPVEQLKSGFCEDANDNVACFIKTTEGVPCMWLGDFPVFQKTGCVNIVELCTSINDLETCRNSSSDYYNGEDLCLWPYGENPEPDPYFKALCIPRNSRDINIGTQCIADTGCYPVCGPSNWFKSSVASKMRIVNAPWGYVNEQHLISLLEAIDTESLEITRNQKNIVMYDEFNANGNIIRGGAIDSNNLDEETTTVLVQSIEKRTKKIVDLTDEGKIDTDKVNVPVLIDEYLKISAINTSKMKNDTPITIIGTPICEKIGTSDEGWYLDGKLIKNDKCTCEALCKTKNTQGGGYYSSCTGSLIAQIDCKQSETFQTSESKGVSIISKETALQKAVESAELDIINKIETEDRDGDLLYKIIGSKEERILWIIPFNREKSITIDGETGKIIK